jgi:hypothetical protein
VSDALEPSLKKLAVLACASSELLEDSAPDLAEFVASEIAYAFAATEDDAGFNGDSTSTYAGISGLGAKLVGTKSAIAAASGHNTFLTIDSTDIANLMGGVLATAIPSAAFYVSALSYAQTLCRLAAVSEGGMICEVDDPLMVVFGSDAEGPIAVAEVERSEWLRFYIRAGGVAAFCADQTFWRLLAEGPVVCVFEDHIDAHAIVDAYLEARRRRLH